MLKRDIQVKTRLNTDEYFQLSRTAKQSLMSISGFIRRCCLSDEKVIVIDRRLISDVYREMNAIGKNLNHIARIANGEKAISPESLDRVDALLEMIWEIVDEKLGGIKRK